MLMTYSIYFSSPKQNLEKSLNILLSQGIYLDSKKDFSYYFVSSYMKHDDTHQIYNYNFNIKVIKDNLEFNRL